MTYTLKQTVFLRVKKWVPHFSITNGQASYISMPINSRDWRNKFSLAMGFRPDPLKSNFEDDIELPEIEDSDAIPDQIPGADGVLLFASDAQGPNRDFIWLGVHRGFVEFRYDLGFGPAKLQSSIKISRGKWNFVRIIRQGKYVMMIINEREKITGEAPGNSNLLRISGNLNIGGIPPKFPGKPDPEGGAGFFGCIKDFILNNRIVELPNPKTREQKLLKHISGNTELIKGLLGGVEKIKSVNVGSCKSYRKNKRKLKRAAENRRH